MADPSAGRRGRLPLLIAIIVGLLAIGAAYVIARPDSDESGANKRDGCVRLEVNSSTEKGDLLAELADDYNDAGRTFGGRCAEVSVHKVTSGTAMQALAAGWDAKRDGAPQPQVWTPTSSLWLDLLTERGKAADRTLLSAGRPESIAQSPMTIAMPRPKAEALGWPGKKIGWADILSLAQDPKGWGSHGHPEWGRFTMGKDNPRTSTSGFAATVATYYAASGLSSDLPLAKVRDKKVLEFVRGVEASVAHYDPDGVHFMVNLAEADQKGQAMSYLSAMIAQEQLLYLYNQGSPSGDPTQIGKGRKPQVPLVAIYPKDGTLMLDHPYVVLPSASPQQRAAAADFLAYLKEPAQQRRFSGHGFRDHNGKSSTELARTVGARVEQKLSLIDPPTPQVLRAILDGWDDVRKKAKVLLVMDVSGSMNESADDGKSKLEAAKQAAIEALNQLHPDDEVGLWSFSTETDTNPSPYTEQLPLSRIGDDKAKLVSAINGLHADGGTALYATVRAAQQRMLGELAADRINAVVVLSDGKNEYPDDNDLDALLRDLDATNLERSVRVFPVAFGDKADLDTLTRIGKASKGVAYDARNPAAIDKVFLSVLSNF